MPDLSNASEIFTWIPFYTELAKKLIPFRDRQKELIDFLESLRKGGLPITSLDDKDESGRRMLLTELDPFTVFGVFNRGINNPNRVKIIEQFKKHFGIASPVPRDFAGIPVINNQSSCFFWHQPDRRPEDIPTLWAVFEAAQGPDPLRDAAFQKAFDEALQNYGVNVNLTMGLFWIRPDVFASVDSFLRKHTDIQLPTGGLTFAFYRDFLADVKKRFSGGFPKLSRDAWIGGHETPPPSPTDVDYWMVGAYWDNQETPDQTARFLEEGVWENNYTDKYLDLVRSMKVGDHIAIKASTTQTIGLPFDNRGKTISKMVIKATGTIVKNHGDGRTVEVEWEPDPKERAWYFYTGRSTVWRLAKNDEGAKQLIRFAFEGKDQDYAYWTKLDSPLRVPPGPQPYGIDDVISEGAFLSRPEVERMVERLRLKKNVILQGPPGVGKTFLARKVAYALMEYRDEDRITSVQFHPSYSYEDFIQGYRPTSDVGRFDLKLGPFLELCDRARHEPDRAHVLLIDEINRGNTSQIFGELLLLLESDKRGASHSVVPLYRRAADETLSVPENVYVIGTMNTADRSLALVDYALRRRFAFFTLPPCFGPPFISWLIERKMPDDLAKLIANRMITLNDQIGSDAQLGEGFRIGHSFFCPRGQDFSSLDRQWYHDVLDTEIVPLLAEYWYDAPAKVRAAESALKT